MMLEPGAEEMPIVFVGEYGGAEIFMLREDLRHPGLSGNKFWKLLLPVKSYLASKPDSPKIITFGGAFSNHIAATAYLGQKFNLPTLGIIRGEELAGNFSKNPTLHLASSLGMQLRFISRNHYRQQDKLLETTAAENPGALIIPEGGKLAQAAEGVAMLLSDQTAIFDYLCAPVGTGTTLAGLLKGAAPGQKVLGVSVVRDAGLRQQICILAESDNFDLWDGSFGGYGKFDEEVIGFINDFFRKTQIPLDPVYTGKMMKKVISQALSGAFPTGSRVLCVHTGGLQGILGANELLKKKNRTQIEFRFV